MMILQIVPHYFPSRSFGGVMQTAHALGKSLTQQSCQVSVCTTSMDTHFTDLAVPLDQAVEVDGVRVVYSRVVRNKILRRWGFSFSLLFNIWRALGSADLVILHFHYQYATWLAGLLCRLRRKPYIIFTHGSLNRRAIRASGAWKKRAYLNLLEKGNFRAAAFVVYHSEEELRDSLQFNPRSIVLPNGIDPSAFSPAPPAGLLVERFPELAGRFVYLFLGRLDPNKGLDVLLPAFARVRGAYPQAHLLLAGPDERGYRRQVEDLIGCLGLEQAVTLAGYLGGDLRLAALRDSHAFVLPSRYEGMSMALLEALYHALPAVTTPYVGLSQRLARERCALVSELDEECLAGAMREILRNPEEARQMGLRARAMMVADYTWDTIAASLLDRLIDLRPGGCLSKIE